MRLIIPKEIWDPRVAQWFYGIDVCDAGDKVVVTIDDEVSGVLPEYRDRVKDYLIRLGFSEEEAEIIASHNPLQYIALIAALLGIAYYLYKEREQISEYVWKVIVPLFTFGFGLWVGKKALGG